MVIEYKVKVGDEVEVGDALVILEAMKMMNSLDAKAAGTVKEIKCEIEKMEPIENIHHIHIWSLDDSRVMMECHIAVDGSLKVVESEKILEEIENLLHHKFNISHITVQFETEDYSCKECH